MIYKKCIMTIAKNGATLDEDIYLYRLDKNVELHFTIVNNKYKFDKSDMNNIISQTNAAYFQIRLYKNADIKYTFAIQPTDAGKAILTITDDLIDDPIEVGEYDFQISLLDEEKTSMISMPIVSKQLHVCEPLVSEDAVMGKAVLGLSKAAKGEIKNAFDSQGNYIREIHNDGEIISASTFNKFEEALETNTKAIKNGTGGTGTSYDDTAIKADIQTLKDSQINLVTDETSMEGIKDNEYPTLNTQDKTLIGSINELNTQYKDIANKINILTSPDGTKWEIKIDNSGNLTAELYNENGELLLSFSNLTYQNKQLTLVYVVTDRDTTNGYVPKKWLYTMPSNNGWCFMVSENTFNNPVYLCDWDKSKCETSYQDPQYYTHCLTKEGDIISVFRSYAICGTGTSVIKSTRKNPIVYNHTDYSAQIINFDNDDNETITGDNIGLTRLSNFGIEKDYDVGQMRYYGTNDIFTYCFEVPINKNKYVTINATNNNRFRISEFDSLIPTTSTSSYNCDSIINDDSLNTYSFIPKKKYIYIYLNNNHLNSNLTFTVSISNVTKNTINYTRISNYGIEDNSIVKYYGNDNLYTYLIPIENKKNIYISSSNNSRFRLIALNDEVINNSGNNYTGTLIYTSGTSNNPLIYEYNFPNDNNYKYLALYLDNANEPTLNVTYDDITTGDCISKTSYTYNAPLSLVEKPSAWLQNCGVEVFDGYILFGEYTRPAIGLNTNVWKVSEPYTDLANWTKVKSMEISREYNGDLKHIHTLTYDVYGDVIYMATGDHNEGASIYYSKDEGVTWTQLGYGELNCRLLNMIFTRNYIYWASDSGLSGKHAVFRVGRLTNGVIDFANLEKLCDYPYVSSQQATYSTVFVKNKNILLFLDRFDETGNSMNMYYYDITNNKFDTIGTITSVNNTNVNLGFRCSAVNWYATNTNEIVCGFGINENPCYIDKCGNTSDYNLKNLVLKVQ